MKDGDLGPYFDSWGNQFYLERLGPGQYLKTYLPNQPHMDKVPTAEEWAKRMRSGAE